MDTNFFCSTIESVEDNIKVFQFAGSWGIINLESGHKTLPCFDRVVTSERYIFVESNGYWGILDKELRIIAPSVFKKIIPVQSIERNSYIQNCRKSQSPSDLEKEVDGHTTVAVQNTRILSNLMSPHLYPDDILGDHYEEKDKAEFFEIIQELEKAITGTFVVITDRNINLINVDSATISLTSGSYGKTVYLLWHYKDNLFITQDYKGNYGYATYHKGRLFQHYFKYERNEHYISVGGISALSFQGEDFVSVCESKNNNGSELWGVFKYKHNNPSEEEDGSIYEYSSLDQLIPFALEMPLERTQNPLVFICRAFGYAFFVEYRNSADVHSEKIDAFYLKEHGEDSSSKLVLLRSSIEDSFKVISPYYDSIQLRDDGLYDVRSTSDYHYGICDKNGNIIVPTQYEDPLDWGGQLVLVSQEGKFGIIDHQAKTIVPCSYDSIIVSRENSTIWTDESEYYDDWRDDFVGAHNAKYDLYNNIDYISPNEDLQKEGYYIIGINKNTIGNDKNRLLAQLKYIVNKDKARCDILLPNGSYVTTFQIGFKGGIKYIKEYAIFASYQSSDYDEYEGEFFEKVSLYSCSLKKKSQTYEQAVMISTNAYLAYNNEVVGLMAVCDGNEIFERTLIPYEYKLMTLPINGIIYALREDEEDKCILDVFDITSSTKKVLSCTSDKISLSGDRKDITEEVLVCLKTNKTSIDNILREDQIKEVIWFPFMHDYDYDYHEQQSNEYSSDEGLRDAFEDDPEAMWGRLD